MIDEQSQRVDMTIRLRPLSHRAGFSAIGLLYTPNKTERVTYVQEWFPTMIPSLDH